MYPHVNIEDAQFGADGGFDSSSSGGSSPISSRSGTSESDGSGSSYADEFSFYLTSLVITESSTYVLDDIHRHRQRMLALLPAFSSPSGAGARADALSRWLAGFDVGWVLDMGGGGRVPRREVGRRVRAWAQALSSMERVFRFDGQRELTVKQVEALEELATASAGAMLKLPGAVAALGSSPSKLLAALDVYVPVSETFPILLRIFSWGPSHPVSSAAADMLAALVDAARSCGRDLRTFIRSHYTWQMNQNGEVHPCVGFWMGYFCRMMHNRMCHFILGGGGDDDDGSSGDAPLAAPGGLGLVAELISCLEAVLEEKSAALEFPGLLQVFMLNNTFAILRRAVRSDLKLFLTKEWFRVRDKRMEGYMKGYMDASWAPIVSSLDDAGGTTVLRRRTSRLGTFYTALDNACSAQRCWKVPNPVLRGVLRNTVSANVVPAYRRYLEDHPEVEVAAGRSADELEQQLPNLFEG